VVAYEDVEVSVAAISDGIVFVEDAEDGFSLVVGEELRGSGGHGRPDEGLGGEAGEEVVGASTAPLNGIGSGPSNRPDGFTPVGAWGARVVYFRKSGFGRFRNEEEGLLKPKIGGRIRTFNPFTKTLVSVEGVGATAVALLASLGGSEEVGGVGGRVHKSDDE
jgi:hypothetical protein